MSLVSWLYRLARAAADAKAVGSGSGKKMARRAKNKALGRAGHLEEVTLLEIIGEAAKLIEDRKHWTRGVPACNKWNKAVSVDSPDAVRWCALAAIWKVSPSTLEARDARRVLEGALRGIREDRYWPITSLNDNEGHMAVQSLFGLALS